MRTFENFIESEAFFPVLILLLVLLVCVFMWIMMSNKKEIKKRNYLRSTNYSCSYWYNSIFCILINS